MAQLINILEMMFPYPWWGYVLIFIGTFLYTYVWIKGVER